MYQPNNYTFYPQTQYQSQQNIVPQTSVVLKGRPVASLDEVRATSIDFDGSIFYFPDLANKRIYTKQINVDGTSTLNMYELKPIPNQIDVQNNNYITREEFEAAITQIKNSLTVPKKEEIECKF